MSEATPPPPTEQEINAAYLENQVRSDLVQDEFGNPLTTDQATQHVANRASTDPDYHRTATEVLEAKGVSDPDQDQALREALYVRPVIPDKPPEQPRQAPEKAPFSADFNDVMKLVSKTAERDKVLGRADDLKPHREQAITSARDALRKALADDPVQIVAILKMRKQMAEKAGIFNDAKTRNEDRIAEAQAKAREDRTLPTAPDPKSASIPGIPLLSKSVHEDGSGGKKFGWHIRKTRIGKPERVDIGDGRKRYHSGSNEARRRHAEDVAEIKDRDVVLIRKQLGHAALMEGNSAAKDYAALEEIFSGIPELEDKTGMADHIRSTFPEPTALDARVNSAIDSQFDRSNPNAAASAFTTMRQLNYYLVTVNGAMDRMSVYDAEYRKLYDTRAELMRISVVASYKNDQLRILDTTYRGNNFGRQRRAGYLPDKGIVEEGSPVVRYPDGSYAIARAGALVPDRRNPDGTEWVQSHTLTPSDPRPQIIRGLPTSGLVAKQREAHLAWFKNQDDPDAMYVAQQYSQAVVSRLVAGGTITNPADIRLANELTYWSSFLTTMPGEPLSADSPHIDVDGASVVNASFYGMRGRWSTYANGAMALTQRDGAGNWRRVRQFDAYGNDIPV